MWPCWRRCHWGWALRCSPTHCCLWLSDQDVSSSCSCHHAFTLPPWTLPSEVVISIKGFLLQVALQHLCPEDCEGSEFIQLVRLPNDRLPPWEERKWTVLFMVGYGCWGIMEKPHCDSNTDAKSVLRHWLGIFLWKGLAFNLLCSQKWPGTSYPPAKCQSYRHASNLVYAVLGIEFRPSLKQSSNWAASLSLIGGCLELREKGPTQLKPTACLGECSVSSERVTVRILEGMLVMISWEMRKGEEMPNSLLC